MHLRPVPLGTAELFADHLQRPSVQAALDDPECRVEGIAELMGAEHVLEAGLRLVRQWWNRTDHDLDVLAVSRIDKRGVHRAIRRDGEVSDIDGYDQG